LLVTFSFFSTKKNFKIFGFFSVFLGIKNYFFNKLKQLKAISQIMLSFKLLNTLKGGDKLEKENKGVEEDRHVKNTKMFQ
jgi:hypothetical protein